MIRYWASAFGSAHLYKKNAVTLSGPSTNKQYHSQKNGQPQIHATLNHGQTKFNHD